MTPRSLPTMQWIIRQDAADGAAWFVIADAVRGQDVTPQLLVYIINNPVMLFSSRRPPVLVI
jgi:hypothetical protein